MVISARSEVSADHVSWELLRAIARTPNSVDIDRIDWLAQRVQNWEALIDLAEQHRMAPMLFTRLEDRASTIPQVTLLQAVYDRNILRSLANAAELISLLKAFDQEKIAAMPFKGVVLGASLYHDLTTRPAGDLDLLIYYTDLQRATAILLKRGYELLSEVQADGSPATSECYEYQFQRPSDGMIVELRWRLGLTWRKFKRDLGLDWIWPQQRTVVLAGAEVPNMSPETTLLVLCMHGTKHAWSRLIWICDVARLLDSPGLDWQEVTGQAKRSGLQRCLGLGVLLAHRITGAAVPAALLQRFESDAPGSRLARHIEENLFSAPGSRPPGRLPYSIQVLDLPDRIRLLWSLDLLRPNEKDQAVLPLPKYLHPLYYLLRPVRLLADRSAR